MANRLAELETMVIGERKKNKNNSMLLKSAKHRTQSLTRLIGKRRVKSLSKHFDVKIPGVISVIAQTNSMACWATVFTMLYGWKRSQSFTIEQTLSEIGQKWVDLYTNNAGLSSTDKVDFVATSGLIAEPPMNFSIEGWKNLIESYGPIWVTTDEAPGLPWAIHARIITRIRGDGTPEGTKLSIIDPAGGRQYSESIATFIPKYEEEVMRTGHTRIQVLHWPSDARLSSHKTLARQYTQDKCGPQFVSKEQSTQENISQAQNAGYLKVGKEVLKGIGWVLKKLNGSRGNITYDLQKIEGKIHPWNKADVFDHGPWLEKSWPFKASMESLGFDDVFIELQLRYRYNYHSIQDVYFTIKDYDRAINRQLVVTAEFHPDPNVYRMGNLRAVTRVRLDLRYGFETTTMVSSDNVITESVYLYSTGHVHDVDDRSITPEFEQESVIDDIKSNSKRGVSKVSSPKDLSVRADLTALNNIKSMELSVPGISMEDGPFPMAMASPSNPENFKKLASGIWNSNSSITVQGGQAMWFKIKNLNVLGTTIQITDQARQTQSSIILPQQTVHFTFAIFGSEPMGWKIDIRTNSDVFHVSYELWSTWVPGDAPNG